MNTLHEMIKIAEIHADRITLATQTLKKIFPLDADKAARLNQQELLWVELLVSRFAKLQDFLGKTLIDAFLSSIGEYTDNATMIDKINLLERLEIIENAEIWKLMREARNHISHEYPEHPELTARYLNQIFDLAPKLLNILGKIQHKSPI